MSTLVGRIITERYRVDEFLGKGGMADVYKVWDTQRSTYLAMKVLHADLAEDKVFLRRFKREAQTLDGLQHPSIVRFFGFEQDGPLYYMLMEHVEGVTLRREVFTRNPLTPGQALWLMQPICSALHYAHQNGWVHCDIKPANIMLEKSGRILLADFGIARMTEGATTATMVGAGTPAYMAPEQARGDNPSAQTDIYALGIILFEMLTGGERPFTGEKATVTGTVGEKIRWEKRNLTPPSPRDYNPNISPELESVVLRCLSKDRRKRYASVSAFLEDLERAVDGPAEPMQIEIPAKAASAETEAVQTGKKKWSPWIYVGVGVSLLVCLGISAAALLLGLGLNNKPAAETKVVKIPTSTKISAAATPAATATKMPTPTPSGPPPITKDNYQSLTVLHEWSVNEVDEIKGIALSGDMKHVALMTWQYPSLCKIPLRNIESGKSVWETAAEVCSEYPALAYAPEGGRIAVGSDDGAIRIYRTSDGGQENKLLGHTYNVRAVAFSPDGKSLASSASDNTVRVWAIPGGAQRFPPLQNATIARDVAISLDGRYLAYPSNVVNYQNISVNDSKQPFFDPTGKTQELTEVTFSLDGRYIATSGDWFNTNNQKWRKRILLWDVSSPRSPTLIPVDDAVEYLEFSTDSKLLLGVSRGQLIFYDIVERAPTYTKPLAVVTKRLHLSYAPNLRLFALVSNKKTVQIWGVQP